MSRYAKLISVPVPQSEPLDSRQVQNNAGGYVYTVDNWSRLNRFLILGSDSPTYYQTAQKLTRENAKCVDDCYAIDPQRTVDTIVAVSEAGRAAKNDQAIFALALGAVSKDERTRQLALAAMPRVCRTGTHLFQFVEISRALGRGWGRAMKRAVGNWYNAKSTDQVAFQVIKYRQREGYTHTRLMQTAHPSPMGDTERLALYRWLWGKAPAFNELPRFIQGHIQAMGTKDVNEWVKLTRDFNLPWEALPTEANTEASVWKTMLPTMGMTAMIRNLGNMSKHGAITPLSEAEDIVVRRLNDPVALKKSRIHPFNLLQAQVTYASGKGARGKGAWNVSKPVVSALDDAFYKAFDNVEPTGKRILVAVDVSGSMDWSGQLLTPRQIAAAMAMVTVRTEQRWHTLGFSHDLVELPLSPKDSLETVMRKMQSVPMGGTDCSLPMIYAMNNNIDVDAFIVITDNETWAGRVHPAKALQQYRAKSGINAKLIVMGVTATEFSIADPDDNGMLDVVGMDTSVPAIMADFIKG